MLTLRTHEFIRTPLFLLLLTMCAVSGCSSGNSPSSKNDDSVRSVEGARLLGKWNATFSVPLENDLVVIGDSDYEFGESGVFTNTARTRLANSLTDETLSSSTTLETGTWTITGSTVCWTIQSAKLEEFESFTKSITREMMEENLAAESGADCFAIVPADDGRFYLKPTDGGDAITLTRKN